MTFTIPNEKVGIFRDLVEAYMYPYIEALKYHTSGNSTTISVPDRVIAGLKGDELQKLMTITYKNEV